VSRSAIFSNGKKICPRLNGAHQTSGLPRLKISRNRFMGIFDVPDYLAGELGFEPRQTESESVATVTPFPNKSNSLERCHKVACDRIGKTPVVAPF
jgi:hypothetical protein